MTDVFPSISCSPDSRRVTRSQTLPTPGTAAIHHEDVLRFLESLPDESLDLIVTDPAYSGMNQHLRLGRGRIVGVYDDRGSETGKWFGEFEDTEDNYFYFLRECHRVLKKNRHIFLMFDSYSLLTLGPLVRKQFNLKNIIVWDKVNIGMGHYFRRQTELILFASKGKRPLTRPDIPDVWKIRRIHKALYPTQKPVEVFEAMIASSKSKSDTDFVVCDPFVGSGSAAIAALRQGATFIGCDVAEPSIVMSRGRIDHFLRTGEDMCQKSSAVDPKQQKVFW